MYYYCQLCATVLRQLSVGALNRRVKNVIKLLKTPIVYVVDGAFF